jgi:putative lipoprotein
VTYRGLVTLAADARLTVQLVEISRVAEAEVVLAEQAIVPVGGPGPFQFEIGYDPASIKPNGVYLVGASIVSGGNVVYWTTTRPGVITQGRPMTVDVVLAEAAPSSYANMALSSGRLAPSTY